MKLFLPKVLLSLTFIILLCMACGQNDDLPTEMDDYRLQWVGNYEGTKSNVSFDDTMFTSPVSFDVSIDSSSTDGLIVNDILLTISEEGTYGPDYIDDIYNYTVTFEDKEVQLESFGTIPNGIILPCFIKAVKQ